MVLWKGIGIMKNGILAIIGLCVWGGLLMLQGTPKVSEEIAADVVQTLHPQAEVENVTDTTVGSDRAYRVAYYEGGKAGVVAVSENGQLMHCAGDAARQEKEKRGKRRASLKAKPFFCDWLYQA